MKLVTELTELEGKRVLVRVDWNVPIVDGKVRDDYRIRKSLPTLEFLKNNGAKVTLITHLDPDNASVEPLVKYVPEGMELLENLRHNPGEKNSDLDFAQYLASKADYFVNEAFSTSHRKHASIVGIPQFLPSYAGVQFAEEVRELSKLFNPEHPFTIILGGAKFETKLPLVEKFLDIADNVFILGAMAKPASEMELIKNNSKIHLPHGDIAALDADSETIENCKLKIENSNLILWNGPLGKYEEGYKEGTLELARILENFGKKVVVGGVDTVAAIEEVGHLEKFTFVSTGGGAMLDFLAEGTLPGIEALDTQAQN